MSNFGLDEALAAAAGKVLRTKVGDRYVIETMMREGLNVGGEQSGHMIFRDYATTGDGIVSALQILRIMIETGRPLSELKKVLKKYPQAQRNLKVRENRLSRLSDKCSSSSGKLSKILDGKGRVLLSYSGIERKMVVMVEGFYYRMRNGDGECMASAMCESAGARLLRRVGGGGGVPFGVLRAGGVCAAGGTSLNAETENGGRSTRME